MMVTGDLNMRFLQCEIEAYLQRRVGNYGLDMGLQGHNLDELDEEKSSAAIAALNRLYKKGCVTPGGFECGKKATRFGFEYGEKRYTGTGRFSRSRICPLATQLTKGCVPARLRRWTICASLLWQ